MRRRGVALLVSVIAITTVGILALGSARLARARVQGARGVRGVHRAAPATTRLLDSALAAWPTAERFAMRIGERRLLVTRPDSEWLAVTRSTKSTFRLESTAIRDGGRQSAAAFVRVLRPEVARGAPLVVGGSAVIGPGFAIQPEMVPGCDAPVSPYLAVAGDSTTVRWDRVADAGPVAQDTRLRDSSSFLRPGGVSFERLRSQASLVVPAGGWYSPPDEIPRLVVAEGDLTLGPGAGAGLLVVRGSLSFVGPLRFNGAIQVIGSISGSGRVEILGSLAALGPIELRVEGLLRGDGCAVERTTALGARAVPLPRWALATLP